MLSWSRSFQILFGSRSGSGFFCKDLWSDLDHFATAVSGSDLDPFLLYRGSDVDFIGFRSDPKISEHLKLGVEILPLFIYSLFFSIIFLCFIFYRNQRTSVIILKFKKYFSRVHIGSMTHDTVAYSLWIRQWFKAGSSKGSWKIQSYFFRNKIRNIY